MTSPTDLLTQTVDVSLGNGEMVTVTLESGVFPQPCSNPNICSEQIVVDLLPDTVHHLTVEGKVRRVVNPDGCIYGGYVIGTDSDRYGGPLIRPVVPLHHGNSHRAHGLFERRSWRLVGVK